jgi:hypothetical protein
MRSLYDPLAKAAKELADDVAGMRQELVRERERHRRLARRDPSMATLCVVEDAMIRHAETVEIVLTVAVARKDYDYLRRVMDEVSKALDDLAGKLAQEGLDAGKEEALPPGVVPFGRRR